METGKWIRLVTSRDGGAFPKEMLDDKNFKELNVWKLMSKSMFHTKFKQRIGL